MNSSTVRGSVFASISRGLLGVSALLAAATVSAAVDINNVPITLPTTVPGNLVLVPSVEWPTVVTHANDPALGEGSSNYAPATTYAGYFNSDLCYAYVYDALEANRYFNPVSAAGTNRSCAGLTGGTPTQRLWSGNFLNWVSMQALDTFRLALTGGYRVHRPADGTPPNVTVKGSGLTDVIRATSEMPTVTYLEKANSDRWDDSYTKLRRIASTDTNVANATPSQASTGIRMRIAALRNQMWFLPNTSISMGAGRSFNDPQALSLPVTDGNQAEPGGAAISAVPYNPAQHTLPDADTTTATSGTACATGELGCLPTTPICPDNTWTQNLTNCTRSGTQTACPTSNPNRPFFRVSSGLCRQSNDDTSSSTANLCPASQGWTLPTANAQSPNAAANCTRSTSTALVPQYQRITFGRNQIYAVSIRVKVCDGTLDTRDMCTAYGSNFKPEGLLQRNSKKIRYSLFSYLTESGQTRNGGIMRARQKLISPVTPEEVAGTEKPYPNRTRISGIDNPEWDPSTGVFINNPDTADATATDGNIGSCAVAGSGGAPDNSQCQIKYSGVINYLNRAGQILTGFPKLKEYDNLSEMYYTAIRYLRGLANISSFSSLGGTALQDYQNADGMPVIEDWYKQGANAAVSGWNATTPARTSGTDGDPALYQCQTSVVLGIGDTGTNNEDDADNLTRDSSAPAATWRGYTEWTSGGGQGNLAGLAYWAHLNDLRSDVPNSNVSGGTSGAKRGQTISTYWVDVVELANLQEANRNQFYNATKYGGYTIPDADWTSSGNATRHDLAWFTSNSSVWTSATQQTVRAATNLNGGSANAGNYYQPENMYLANNGQKMIAGLTAAFSKIADNLLGSGASLAANSTKLDTGTTTYQATYVSGEWKGNLKAFAVNPSTGAIATTASWDAAARLPAAASRNIKTCTGTCTGDAEAINFNTTSATAAQRTALAATTTAQDGIINYLRGASTLEIRNGGTLRNRTTPLGDIVNSQPVFVGAPDPNLFNNKSFTGSDSYVSYTATNSSRKKRIYVAANDGMLHGFNAESTSTTGEPLPGEETYAYLPSAVIVTGNLKNLSNPNYGSTTPHQFYNDGELTVSDVYLDGFDSCTGSACWRTVLVGTTGRGFAKSIYALDVTDPTSVKLLWERDSADSTFIGQIVGKPVIAQTANGTWSVLLGNGYNSAHNKPALLKIELKTGNITVAQTTGSSSEDGLAPPAVWIGTPSNNISTEAYAGDLNGNVWKFDLAAGTAGTKIYVAKDASASAKPQPITAGMIAGKNFAVSGNEVWIFFGTGLALKDFAPSTDVQTWYGLIVQGPNAVTSASARSDLRQRSIAVEFAASSTRPVATRGISSATANDMSGKKGWYIDLVKPTSTGSTAQGERMVTPNQFQGALLLGTSRVPADSTTFDACDPSGQGWVMAINPFTGSPPAKNFFDVNNDGSFDANDNAGGGSYVTAGVGFSAIPNNPIFVSNTMLVSFDDASTGSINTRGSSGGVDRLSWRELVVQ